MKQIGLVGFGFMGSAVVRSVRTQFPKLSIGMVEKDTARRDIAASEYGARDYTDRPAELIAESDAIVIAVKPQDFAAIAPQISAGENSPLYISVLAGTSIETLSRRLGTDRIVRIMPSLVAEIGRAVVGMSFGPGVGKADRKLAHSVADGMGTVMEVQEPILAAITGLSGSGVAFVFSFIHALALGGVSQGIPYTAALEGAREVVGGAAALLTESGLHPEEMVSRVASPAGTTIAGLTELYEGSFSATVIAAVGAAADRARELER